MKKQIITAVALAGLALAGAPVASADAETAEEIGYVLTLDQYDIYYYTEDAAIDVGHKICIAFYNGATLDTVVKAGTRGSDGFYSALDVAHIAGAATAAFCPDVYDKISKA